MPPKLRKRRLTKSKGPKPLPGWNDEVTHGIPEYKAYEDEYA
jgi:hypothetical protein